MQDALDWVHTETGQIVKTTRRLFGGLTSDVRAVTLASGESLVLRRYTEWGKAAAPQVVNEAATLHRLAGAGISAPRLVAAKSSGDVPMLLMTRIPGRVWLTPRDHDAWLAQIARTLAQIHDVPVDASSPKPSSRIPRNLDVPEWTTRRELWKSVNAVLATPPDRYTPTFPHSDYQHFNMLWSRTKLGGIVDPWWDLRGMTAYSDDCKKFIPIQVAGRAKVDGAGMDDRVEGLMERILRRV